MGGEGVHAPPLGSGLRRKDGLGSGRPGAERWGGIWRVEATPGVIPELLRLTVSLWSLPCARLKPGGVFQEVRFSSVFPGPCDKRTVWRQLPRQYGRP